MTPCDFYVRSIKGDYGFNSEVVKTFIESSISLPCQL